MKTKYSAEPYCKMSGKGKPGKVLPYASQIRKTQSSRNTTLSRDRSSGCPEEIEIDLNVLDSLVILQHLATICKNIKKSEATLRGQKKQYPVYNVKEDTGIASKRMEYLKDETATALDSVKSIESQKTNDAQRKTESENNDSNEQNRMQSKVNNNNSRVNDEILPSKCDKSNTQSRRTISYAYKTPTRVSIVVKKTSTCHPMDKNYDPILSSSSEYCTSNNSRSKEITINTEDKAVNKKQRVDKMKEELTALKKNCKQKGKEIVKEFKIKEKLRKTEEKKKYKECQKALKNEVKVQKAKAKETLKQHKDKMKKINNEQKTKLKMLQSKIKEKCNGLKNIMDEEKNC